MLWNVCVQRDGIPVHIGQVSESSEALARACALSRFGVSAEEIEAGEVRAKGENIYPDEEFFVTET